MLACNGGVITQALSRDPMLRLVGQAKQCVAAGHHLNGYSIDKPTHTSYNRMCRIFLWIL